MHKIEIYYSQVPGRLQMPMGGQWEVWRWHGVQPAGKERVTVAETETETDTGRGPVGPSFY